MKKIKTDTILFDFDSTLLKGELLEIMAHIQLEGNPKKDIILKEIEKITNLGMEGVIPFNESLDRRLKLLELSEDIIDKAIDRSRELLNEEFKEIMPKIIKKNIYIISGGYKNVLDPLSLDLHVPKKNIHAIKLFFKGGIYSNFDRKSKLINSSGKAEVAKSIKNKGRTIMVGDGMTDYLVKEQGGADYFFAYTGIVQREKVCQKADYVINNLNYLDNIVF